MNRFIRFLASTRPWLDWTLVALAGIELLVGRNAQALRDATIGFVVVALTPSLPDDVLNVRRRRRTKRRGRPES